MLELGLKASENQITPASFMLRTSDFWATLSPFLSFQSRPP
jgi:hypothetical protein